MRRNLCLLVLTALLSLWMTNASAQLRLGVKGGYNYTNWSFGKLKVNKEDKNGFFIGPTLKVSLPTKSSIGFSLNVSGLYDQRKVQVGDTDPVEVTSKMVAVPVNLQLDLLRGSSIELFAYAGPEFDILSVAVWDKKDDTIESAKEQGIVWNQIIDAQRIPTNTYGIDGIPHIILFGPDGTIVKRDLRGDDIEAEVAKHVKPVK